MKRRRCSRYLPTTLMWHFEKPELVHKDSVFRLLLLRGSMYFVQFWGDGWWRGASLRDGCVPQSRSYTIHSVEVACVPCVHRSGNSSSCIACVGSYLYYSIGSYAFRPCRSMSWQGYTQSSCLVVDYTYVSLHVNCIVWCIKSVPEVDTLYAPGDAGKKKDYLYVHVDSSPLLIQCFGCLYSDMHFICESYVNHMWIICGSYVNRMWIICE